MKEDIEKLKKNVEKLIDKAEKIQDLSAYAYLESILEIVLVMQDEDCEIYNTEVE